jgi:hypothetical protein
MTRCRALLLCGVLLQGCTGFEGVSETLNPSGPASLQSSGYDTSVVPKSRGQVGLFEIAYATALADQVRIDRGDLLPPRSPADPVSIHARQMAIEGVHLADSYCSLFFLYGSDNQKWLLVAKDVIGALGTIATGAVAIANPHNATSAGIIALTTGALYNGVDIYTRNFLFNTDNIESVRAMTVGALNADSATAFPANDTSIWTFSGAAQVINGHQAICLPASIRSLVLEAIKGGKFIAAPAAGTVDATATGASSAAATTAAKAQIGAATRAASAAAPVDPSIAAPAAAGAAAAAGPAAAAAAAAPGATTASIREAARAAATAGAQAAAEAASPGAPRTAIQAAANAAASAVAPAAATAATAGAHNPVPTTPPASRQNILHLAPQ